MPNHPSPFTEAPDLLSEDYAGQIGGQRDPATGEGIAGWIYDCNQYGHTRRPYKPPKQFILGPPGVKYKIITMKQIIHRATVRAAATAWTALTDEQRAAWNTIGQRKRIGGYAAFLANTFAPNPREV
jgi:hypothetical protein